LFFIVFVSYVSYILSFVVRVCMLCSLCQGPFGCLLSMLLSKDYYFFICGPGSSVGIATELLAGLSGIESRWGRDLPPVQTSPGAHPTFCKIGTMSFPGVNCGRGVLLTTHPLLVLWSWKSRAIPLPTLWATPDL